MKPNSNMSNPEPTEGNSPSTTDFAFTTRTVFAPMKRHIDPALSEELQKLREAFSTHAPASHASSNASNKPDFMDYYYLSILKKKQEEEKANVKAAEAKADAKADDDSDVKSFPVIDPFLSDMFQTLGSLITQKKEIDDKADDKADVNADVNADAKADDKSSTPSLPFLSNLTTQDRTTLDKAFSTLDKAIALLNTKEKVDAEADKKKLSFKELSLYSCRKISDAIQQGTFDRDSIKIEDGIQEIKAYEEGEDEYITLKENAQGLITRDLNFNLIKHLKNCYYDYILRLMSHKGPAYKMKVPSFDFDDHNRYFKTASSLEENLDVEEHTEVYYKEHLSPSLLYYLVCGVTTYIIANREFTEGKKDEVKTIMAWLIKNCPEEFHQSVPEERNYLVPKKGTTSVNEFIGKEEIAMSKYKSFKSSLSNALSIPYNNMWLVKTILKLFSYRLTHADIAELQSAHKINQSMHNLLLKHMLQMQEIQEPTKEVETIPYDAKLDSDIDEALKNIFPDQIHLKSNIQSSSPDVVVEDHTQPDLQANVNPDVNHALQPNTLTLSMQGCNMHCELRVGYTLSVTNTAEGYLIKCNKADQKFPQNPILLK
jgi:hypothetical protein